MRKSKLKFVMFLWASGPRRNWKREYTRFAGAFGMEPQPVAPPVAPPVIRIYGNQDMLAIALELCERIVNHGEDAHLVAVDIQARLEAARLLDAAASAAEHAFTTITWEDEG